MAHVWISRYRETRWCSKPSPMAFAEAFVGLVAVGRRGFSSDTLMLRCRERHALSHECFSEGRPRFGARSARVNLSPSRMNNLDQTWTDESLACAWDGPIVAPSTTLGSPPP